MPARYYRRAETTGDRSTVDLFFLDTEEISEEYVIHHEGDDEAENRRERAEAFAAIPQLGWLEGELAASRADWKLVFGHHTILSGGDHGPTRELVAAVKPLLERYRVAAYFNGHDHDLQHIAGESLHYFCSGAGARTREVQAVEGTRFFSDRPGFAAVALNARRLRVEFIDYTGATLYSVDVARPS
jgi:acid phosphatase